MERTLIHNRLRYYKNVNGYFVNGSHKVEERYLHRLVWRTHNGVIPSGHIVHHIDGNKSNNKIENLELMTDHDHKSYHASQFTDWHRSEEGRKWHIENGKASWQTRRPTDMVCEHCHIEYKSYFPTRSKYCSKSCRAKAFRARRKV